LVSVFLLTSCSASNEENTLEASDQIIPLEIEETTISASGEVIPLIKTELSYQNNAKALDIKVRPGDIVSQGDVLVESDDLQQIADVESAEARLANAESAYDILKRNFANKIDQDAAIANIEAAASALSLARQNLQLTKLSAPFSGTIIEVYANSFEDVIANEPVILMADMDSLVVETTDLNEIDVNKISLGNRAEISYDAFPELRLEGQVVDIKLKSEIGSGVNYTVTIKFSEVPDNLRWGMSAFVVIDITAD
jgi:multidrug resistance efflux pump